MESYLTGLDDYLTDGFDYLELKVPELRKILQEHNVHYPGNAKKSDLRQIYRNNIIPMIPDIIKSRVNERNVRDNNMSSLSSVTSSPHVQKRTRDDMESSNESQSYLTKNVRTSFSDDSDKDDSMPSNDSLSNVVVQQPTTPNSKRRKTTDNRSNSGTPIVNKVQKKNQSYSADNSNRVSSLPSSESESESEGDHDESISANITNHGKENQNTPTFDFSVNRQAIASSLNEVPTEFRISNSLNIRKDNSSAHTKSYSLIEISDSSDSSGSESDSNNLPPAKMKPLIPIAPLKERYTPITSMQSSSVKQPSSIKQESAPVRQAPILPVKHDTPEKVKDTLNNNSKMGDMSTEHFPIKSNSDLNEAGNIVPRNHMTNVQKNREVSVDEPMDTSEENMQEEKYEDEQQREEVELDEEDEIAELEKEINAQREEEEQSAINLDADIDVDNDVPDDSIEYKNLHERMDEELQKEKRKEILEEENKEKFTPELLKGVPKKSTQTKSRSILKTILKLLFKLVLLILTLILLVIPIVLGLWYREQRVSVGYCGFERKCQTFHDIYPTIDQLTYVDSALAKYAPNCIPCPENSICYPYMKIRCKPGYALQKSKLNLFGLIPMSDKCVKDDKRELLVKEMVQKSLEFLRTKNAELMCGESDDDIKSGISQEDLYNIFSESRAPWIDDEEYEKLWQETLQDLQNEPEIIMRQLLQDRSNIPLDTDFDLSADDIQGKEGYIQQTDRSKKDKYIRSKSKKYIGLRCKFEREIYQTYSKYKYVIWSTALIFTILYYIKFKLRIYFDRKARIVDLTEGMLSKLKSNKGKQPPYLSTVQLRDILLSDVRNLKERNELWEKVTKRLEANNTNIKSSLIEIHGDIMKCWEWIGPIDNDDSNSSLFEGDKDQQKK